MGASDPKRPARARILFCTHDLELGGSPRSMAILAEELARRNELAIITMREPRPDGAAVKKYRRLGIPVYFFPWGWLPAAYVNCPVNLEIQQRRSAAMAPFAPEVARLAAGYDLVCLNGYPAASLAALLPPELPRVLLAREVLLEEYAASPELRQYLRANITAAVAIGPKEAGQLAALGIARTTVFNSSTNPPRFCPMSPAPVKFGIFSRFGPGKGLESAVEAVVIAAASLRGAGASVHIFGGNPQNPNGLERQLRNRIAQAGIGDIMQIHAHTETPEAQMAAMHCVIRPDASGSPWGRDIIEAMSLGRPVLATGDSDVFVKPGGNGWLVPAGACRALAEQLCALACAAPVLEDAGRAAAAFAAANFDRRRNSRRIEDFFTRILARGRREV